jgi:L-ascorbate metabolism protein UlaG (beta-lactamase superfamily)
MKIKYLGHSSFVLTSSSGTSIVTDPYDNTIGYAMAKVSADAVTITHHHFDHDDYARIGGNPTVVDKLGTYKFGDIEITTIHAFHDECNGAKRGVVIIYKYKINGITVCHLGDLGEPYTQQLVDKIGKVDILLIPVGGTYTIDAPMAKKYIEGINPTIAIPMHYKAKGCKLNIEKIDSFISQFKDSDYKVIQSTSELEINAEQLAKEDKKIIVMEKA